MATLSCVTTVVGATEASHTHTPPAAGPGATMRWRAAFGRVSVLAEADGRAAASWL